MYRLKKSKYVESNTGNVFEKVKAELDSGRLVLYCGTSCQIDGLINYLNGEYENLLTCDSCVMVYQQQASLRNTFLTSKHVMEK